MADLHPAQLDLHPDVAPGLRTLVEYLGAGRPDVRREELAQAARRALSAEQLQARGWAR